MKIPNPIRWGFDPRASELPVLATVNGRKVWAAIRARHIVDQYFNDNCAAFVAAIDAAPPASPDALFALARQFGMNVFGKLDTWGQLPDLEFWGELLAWLRGEISIEETIPLPKS